MESCLEEIAFDNAKRMMDRDCLFNSLLHFIVIFFFLKKSIINQSVDFSFVAFIFIIKKFKQKKNEKISVYVQ